MVPGTVTVDELGIETFSPDDDTNAARALYLRLVDAAGGHALHLAEVTPGRHHHDGERRIFTRPKVELVHRPIAVTPVVKQHQASTANLMAGWLLDVLRAEGLGKR